MKAVETIKGTCLPLKRTDVDTDQIIPSDWLKRVERTGFEKGLFSEWRSDPDFVMNKKEYGGAKILLAGANFGTGSSREHAVWAIQQYGFEAVISPKFGDIFKNNSTKCGLVAIELSQQFVDSLFRAVMADPTTQVSIHIKELMATASGKYFAESGQSTNSEADGQANGEPSISEGFYLEPATQERLIKGLDDIGITLMEEDKISAYEASRHGWLSRTA